MRSRGVAGVHDRRPVIVVVRPQTPGPRNSPLAGPSDSRRRSLRSDLSAIAFSLGWLVRRACRARLAMPPALPNKSRWKTVRFPPTVGFERTFPLSHSRGRRKNVRLLSHGQLLPAMARPALNVPRPSSRRKNDCRRFHRAV